MPGKPVEIGPWDGGLKNASGFGEFIEDNQAYLLQNFEVDTDGTLINRPAVAKATVTGVAAGLFGMRLLGTWIAADGTNLLVATSNYGIHIIDPSNSAVVFTHTMTAPRCYVSFDGILDVVPMVAGQGGAISKSGAIYTWTGYAAIPTGISAVLYKDRMYIAQETASRIVYSDVNNFSVWPATNNVSIGFDNKQPLKAMIVVGSDVFLFKSDSTYRYGHAGDPAKAELKQTDAYVGTVNETTIAVYNNNTVYTLSNNAVYELYQGTYTCISKDLDMVRVVEPLNQVNFGVSVAADRLFIRFYTHMYVLSLLTQKWSEWTFVDSIKQFAKVVSLPGHEPNDDYMYMAANRLTGDNRFLNYFQDSRILGIDKEAFTCKLITKSFDFQTPTYYKTILMGGLSVACSSVVKISAVVPGSAVIEQLTWGEAFVQYTWGDAYDLGLTWGTAVTSDGDVLMKTTIPPTDGSAFGRKLLKCLGKFRYRQVQFVIEIPASYNDRASFSVKLYNLTVYALQKETIVASVTP
ncbi:MAG TPA: hypothetical protein VLG09_01750 [Candidatus Saccharimonadales bacterium]|nr:hypothetical protein [Candidatus Saccharimonadales bacterium]